MSVNKYRPHVFVLPEDDADRELANGFQLELPANSRQMLILGEAGGWEYVVARFLGDHCLEMERNPNRYMVLLLDFDEDTTRLEKVTQQIPNNLRERVFVLGVWSFPEALQQVLQKPREWIGRELARACREDATLTWEHPLLRHNTSELDRLRQQVRPIFFPT